MLGTEHSLSGVAMTGAVIALVDLLSVLPFGSMTLSDGAGVPRVLANCHVGSDVTPLVVFLGGMVAVD